MAMTHIKPRLVTVRHEKVAMASIMAAVKRKPQKEPKVLKLRTTTEFDGLRFVFAPMHFEQGIILRFEGSFEGSTKLFIVGRIVDAEHKPLKNRLPVAWDYADIIDVNGVLRAQMRINSVCWSSRWAMVTDKDTIEDFRDKYAKNLG